MKKFLISLLFAVAAVPSFAWPAPAILYKSWFNSFIAFFTPSISIVTWPSLALILSPNKINAEVINVDGKNLNVKIL